MRSMWAWFKDGRAVFLLLPWAYFLLFGFHGWADTDQGFVPGLSWRVACGQWPYLDFLYVRPPLTPFLHTLEIQLLPDSLELLGMRLLYYLMLWASTWWSLQLLRRLSPNLELAWGWLGALGFLFAAHNFPAMPWHTVDGVFFGSLGMYLLWRSDRAPVMALGLLALCLSALAKQPFLVLLPAGLALRLAAGPWRPVLLAAAGAAGAVFALILALATWVLPAGFLQAMMASVSGSSGPMELFRAGFWPYIWPGAPLLIFYLGFLWLWRKRSLGRGGAVWMARLPLLVLALYPALLAAWALWKQDFVAPKLGVYHGLLLVACWAGAQAWFKGERRMAGALLSLTAVAWASGISWGYAVPALLALPGIFGLVATLPQAGKALRLDWVAGLAFVGFAALQLWPYRDAARWELVPGASDVSARMGPVRTSPAHVAQFAELRALVEWFPAAQVLPAAPGTDYLMGRQPVGLLDWEHDGEAGTPRMVEKSVTALMAMEFVIVERSRLGEADSPNPLYRSTALARVISDTTTWIEAERGDYFSLYRRKEHPIMR